jgi:hypothetical protein
MKWALGVAIAASAAATAFGNGGPFVVKYPSGDPAAKGVMARLDPSLKPDRETRLRVLKEDLKIAFGLGEAFEGTRANRAQREVIPLVHVQAAYTIENPTAETIDVDFGFPILRGLYLSPYAMMPVPDVRVTVNNSKSLRPLIISNSAIYGIIRQQARETIEKAIEADKELAQLVAAVRRAQGAEREAARKALAAHLTGSLKWNEREAALLAEYAGLDLGIAKSYPIDGRGGLFGFASGPDGELFRKLTRENLGPLSAIGEQKATQFFACLASRFDPKAATSYEAIFSAWGGDVRERSLDLETGLLRPREINVKPDAGASDPTIYARVDYLDPNAKITDEEKASCKAILKSLPVVFTFAPMNLLHYRVTFPPRGKQLVTVTYRQYAYVDTKAPKTYQFAYVVHPASLWKEFGPINVEVTVPERAGFRGSVHFEKLDWTIVNQPPLPVSPALPVSPVRGKYVTHRATLAEKTGELFLAVDADGWKKALRGTEAAQAPMQQGQQAQRGR